MPPYCQKHQLFFVRELASGHMYCEECKMGENMKTVTVTKTQICAVQTLSDWVDQRIKQLDNFEFDSYFISDADMENVNGRLAELKIIREKIDDGRIQGIGETKFQGDKS